MSPPFSSTRTKVQLKLVVQRLKMLQEKKTSMSKKDRRDVASLVERGKVETARIKTEGVIAEDIHVELLEVLELYCEMLIARLALLDLPGREPDAGLLEPLCALIHAAPRTELKELHVLREMLMARYTREFAIRATEDQEECVPRRITDRLRVQTPDEAYVDAYIAEVCKAYSIPFTSAHAQVQPSIDVPSPPPPLEAQLSTTRSGSNTKSDAAVATSLGTSGAMTSGAQPPGGLVDKPDLHGTTTTTSRQEQQGNGNAAAPAAPGAVSGIAAQESKGKAVDPVDELEKRFAALKRRT
ncbi:DUF292-domain-containing protein [Ceraceosorus guamensis]|uniref:DUF292-domain-containing protein n=1 Tax=Ceraceosorus guamensis TaxID=1522189 RepID=A0A316VP84_9BASI|nr:DUF292-domain-containing protein [Ceraceosorus guamensis]PWN39124.1 DUF292-domain-containing protein [Ceraceosorus guamensis]